MHAESLPAKRQCDGFSSARIRRLCPRRLDADRVAVLEFAE